MTDREPNDKDRAFIQAWPRLMKSPWHAEIARNKKGYSLQTTWIVPRDISRKHVVTSGNRSVPYFDDRMQGENVLIETVSRESWRVKE